MSHFTTLKVASFSLVVATSSAAQDSEGFALSPIWSASGFSMPESVVAVQDHPWLYVSNVNAEAEGFVSRVSPDGGMDTLKWVDGIQTPTGMAVYDGHLYVVDQTQVHQIELATGAITQSFVSETATSLNDIDITPDGRIFVSELQGGAIHTIQDGTLVPWVESTKFPFPNGVLVDGDSLLVGNIGTELSRDLTPDKYGSIYRVSLTDYSVQILPKTEAMGTWDGLAPFADGFLASSPFSNAVWYFNDGGKSLLGDIYGGVADIGTDPEAGILYAPQLFGNTVTAYTLETFQWTRILTADGFGAHVVDVTFGDAGGQSIAKADGTITGNFGGQDLRGSWEWDGEYFCRISTLGDLDLGHDCLVIEVTDSQMRLTLLEGAGPSIIYDRKD